MAFPHKRRGHEERRVLDPELPRKVDGPRLAAEGHPRRRYLELLIVTLPLLGHIEHLSPLTWCPRNLTLSTPPTSSRGRSSGCRTSRRSRSGPRKCRRLFDYTQPRGSAPQVLAASANKPAPSVVVSGFGALVGRLCRLASIQAAVPCSRWLSGWETAPCGAFCAGSE